MASPARMAQGKRRGSPDLALAGAGPVAFGCHCRDAAAPQPKPLRNWFEAVWPLCGQKNGGRMLGLQRLQVFNDSQIAAPATTCLGN